MKRNFLFMLLLTLLPLVGWAQLDPDPNGPSVPVVDVPAALPTVVLQVEPRTDVILPWGLPFELTGAMINLTPTNYNDFSAGGLNEKVAEKLKINEDLTKVTTLGLHNFTIGLAVDGDNIVAFGDANYLISPTGTGRADIRKGNNVIVDDATTNKPKWFWNTTGLTYNGQFQELIVGADYSFTSWGYATGENAPYGKGTAKVVSKTGEGANTVVEIKVLTNEAVGGTQESANYFLTKNFYIKADPENAPAGRLQLFEEDETTGDLKAVETPHDGVFIETEAVRWSTYDNVKFAFLTQAQVDALKAAYDAEQAAATEPSGLEFDVETNVDPTTLVWEYTKTTLPTGKDAGNYYVWAKGSGSDFYNEGTPVYVGVTTIAQAQPTGLTGSITLDPATYYVYTADTDNNWKGLYRSDKTKPAINPTCELTVSVEGGSEKVASDNIEYFVKFGSKQADGTITYAWTDPNNPTTFASMTSFPEGYYQLVARSKATANIDRYMAGLSTVTANFEVKKPAVVIKTKINGEESGTFGYRTDVTGFTAVPDWTAKGYDPGTNATFAMSGQTWKNGEAVVTTTPKPVGTYKVYANGTITLPDYFDQTPVIEPATVIITEANILAEVAQNQTLVYGQTLPLTLTYLSGGFAPESQDIENFNKEVWKSGFTAQAIDPETGEPIADKEAIKLYADVQTSYQNGHRVTTVTTSILPVGTYKVTANVTDNDYSNFKILASEGTWTITPKDINDNGNDRVRGMNGFGKDKTYTSKEITLYEAPNVEEETAGFNDLANVFYYRRGYGVNPYNFYYGYLQVGEDFEITGYKNNINAGTATVTIQGIGNFKGERDLNFTIKKAKIYAFPTKTGHNTWQLGSAEVDEDGNSIYAVDWDGTDNVTVVENNREKTIKRGIYAQLHEGFENDRLLIRDMKPEPGFRALAVKRRVGETRGVYSDGLVTYVIDDEKAVNYEFVCQTAPLEITQGIIELAVADAEVDYNGTTKPDGYSKEFKLANPNKVSDVLVSNDNWKTVRSTEHASEVEWSDNLDSKKEEIAGSDPKAYRYPAGKYTLTCTEFPEGTYSSNDYKFVLVTTTGTLTVNPATVSIAVKPNVDGAPENTYVKNYQDFITTAGEWNKDNPTNPKTAEKIKNEWVSDFGTVEEDDESVVDVNLVTVTPVQKEGDAVTDLITSIYVNENNEIIIVKNASNKNYDINVTNGTLLINPVNGILALTSEPIRFYTDQYDDFTDVKGVDLPEGTEPIIKNPYGCEDPIVPADVFVIQANDQVPYKAVTIKLNPAAMDPDEAGAYSQWKAGEWHTMVLPFATTVGEVAYNFGYAIVNVVDPDATEASTKPNDVHFKLQEIMDEIPANTPFCIKSQYDYDFDDEEKILKFGNIEGALMAKTGDIKPIVIEYKDKEDVWSDAGKGFKFRGTYNIKYITKDDTNLLFLGPQSKWKRFKSTSTAMYTMQPYTGFVDLGSLKETREINFIFEEEDGSTTSINAADFMNGNKANAEGLYRIDGVKVQGATTQKGVYIQDGKKFVK